MQLHRSCCLPDASGKQKNSWRSWWKESTKKKVSRVVVVESVEVVVRLRLQNDAVCDWVDGQVPWDPHIDRLYFESHIVHKVVNHHSVYARFGKEDKPYRADPLHRKHGPSPFDSGSTSSM